MRCSYHKNDVTVLLKDVTGQLPPLPAEQRERLIQSGVHYSEMLPLEHTPSPRYLELYHQSLAVHGAITAEAVRVSAQRILALRGAAVVLVSLARAGTPVGILIKRYLKRFYSLDIPHYTVSIIRGRGIDHNAMRYLLQRHPPESLQFVDGWIGKGAIISELREAVGQYPGVSADLAVLADTAGLTGLRGSSEDFLIPSSCLNATVSGLFSRTILNRDIIGPDDFHGAVYFDELAGSDLSNHFIDSIAARFLPPAAVLPEAGGGGGANNPDVEHIMADFGVRNLHFVKPGIGETTRVLLRRIPWKVLLRDEEDTDHVGHIQCLCREKGIECIRYPLKAYRACGIIRALGDL